MTDIAQSLYNIQLPSGGLATPDLARLTSGSLNGTGVFDKLAKVVKLHLQEEYDKERITSDDYAEIWLGALQATLQQSVEYIVRYPSEEETIARVGLLRQQTVTELMKTDDDIPTGLGFNNSALLEGLMAKELAGIEKDNEVKTQQILSATAEVDLMKQKVATEVAQTDDSLSGLAAYGIKNSQYTTVEGMIGAQRDQAAANVKLAEQKVVSEIAQYNDVLPVGFGYNDSTVIGSLVFEERNKIKEEIKLLSQKGLTELAQTYDGSSGNLPTNNGYVTAGYALGGVVTAQKSLYGKQADGFDRDAEQKLLKIFMEPMIATIAAEAGSTTGSGMDNANIAIVAAHGMDGLGLTPTP
jgi:hypothetical protein